MKIFYMVMFFIAIFLCLGIWLVLGREGKTLSARAEITDKVFKEASTYNRSFAGPNRGFMGNNSIAIAESYVLVLKIEGEKKPAAYGLNEILAKSYNKGQTVNIEYVKKGIPFVWEIIQVKSINP